MNIFLTLPIHKTLYSTIFLCFFCSGLRAQSLLSETFQADGQLSGLTLSIDPMDLQNLYDTIDFTVTSAPSGMNQTAGVLKPKEEIGVSADTGINQNLILPEAIGGLGATLFGQEESDERLFFVAATLGPGDLGNRISSDTFVFADVLLTDPSLTLTYELNFADDGVQVGALSGELKIGGETLFGDCNNDNTLDALDLDCVSTIDARDAVLEALNSLPGDLDGNGGVDFSDFLVLSSNFGESQPSYSSGNIDLTGNIEFADFLVLSQNFGQTGAAASVPEPTSATCLLISMLLAFRLRSRSKRQLLNPFVSRQTLLPAE